MSQKPDIILIVLDTQRADRLGCYGYSKAQTPNLDRFAASGALFKMGISPAQWTIPSHASLFTGHYPTVHQVTQSNQALSPNHPHLAELLAASGYETVGFCNNPLVGVLENGFRRGFDAFYNYCGATPNAYKNATELPVPLHKIRSWVSKKIRDIAIPIQNYFGDSDLALRISMHAWLTPIWSRFANFKGQNERSARHLANFFQAREQTEPEKPLFLFYNLMETHLPFKPPAKYIEKKAPYILHNAAAKAEMRRWNREAYRWAAPLAEPLSDLESRVLSDLYDAEVAYQDDYLGMLFARLAQRKNAKNTLTIIVGDHGDGLGEHDQVGHAFNAYQELLHVPLIVHWPQKIATNTQADKPVSTRRAFHTVLAAAGVAMGDALTLLHEIEGSRVEPAAYAEVYPPLNFVTAIQHRQPELLERFKCEALRRAVVSDDEKLIHVDGVSAEKYNLTIDPLELTNTLPSAKKADVAPLNERLVGFSADVEQQRSEVAAGGTIDLDDEKLLQQLRSLGYIE